MVGGDAEWYEQQNEHIKLRLPLVEEARQGWFHEVTRRLRENGEDVNAAAPDGATLLHVAAAAGRRKLVEELILQHGASVAPRDRMGRTPLVCAAEQTSETVCETLVEHGGGVVDVNSADVSGATALHVAARLGHVRIVRWLCSRPELAPNVYDEYGVAALHKATSFGQLACVEALLHDRRVDVNLPCGKPTVPESFQALSGGETALLLAASHTYVFHHTKHGPIAGLLLDAGADPNATDARGRTAVHCAAAAGNVAILRQLANSGRVADWDAADHDGKRPSDLAKGNAAVLDALRAGRAMMRQRRASTRG